MTHFIFVVGGVSSSLGKGITAASVGSLLQMRGYKVRLRKFEPYINVDPGTMSPLQHGEVFVTEDGAETDLDLGHYERFTDVECRRSDAVSTGQIYSKVIERERQGDYLGATIQVVPHITNAIQEAILEDLEQDLDFLIVEIGGTVGDIEGLPFLEAIRQFSYGHGEGKTLFLYLTLIPYIEAAGEMKTKPAQHSVKELQRVGIQPDILLCRSAYALEEETRQKLALFCNMKPSRVLQALDASSLFQVPMNYGQEGLDREILSFFHLKAPKPAASIWASLEKKRLKSTKKVRLAVVGKYVALPDAYKSLSEALYHAGIHQEISVELTWLSGENVMPTQKGIPSCDKAEDPGVQGLLAPFDGILVPGGHGRRAIEGKMAAINHARTNQKPYLGLCLGMQLAVIEFAQNVLGDTRATSEEFSQEGNPYIGLLTHWIKGHEKIQRTSQDRLGGTMRLGSYPCVLQKESKIRAIYDQERIYERHRHRYEVNTTYRDALENQGLLFTGMSPDGLLPEMIELTDHPWFVATQAHPEFRSRPHKPHPLFISFIKACYDYRHGSKNLRKGASL